VQFDSTLDITGIATMFLAVTTAILAGQTREAARATQDEAQLAREQIETQQRPVVIPTGELQFSTMALNIACVNHGLGPALYVRIAVGSDESSWLMERTPATVIAVGDQRVFAIETDLPALLARGRPVFVKWMYEDVSGGSWNTTVRIVSGEQPTDFEIGLDPSPPARV
jgi:hypothetical protein